MKKRSLLMILALALSLTLAIGGTLAYLQDTDADVNVMTLGSVHIVQNEQERNEDGDLVAFKPNKPAFPAVGPITWADETITFGDSEFKVFTDDLKNVVDKFVTVTNTGKSDAYVRTIIAIEAPDYDPNNLIHVNVNNTNGVSNTSWAPVVIDTVQYVYSVFTYDEALAAGETSLPSLMQLFLDSETTNEDVAKFGDTWEVLVLSQAMQTEGFENAETALNTGFGEATKEHVAEWFGDWEAWEEGKEIGSPNGKLPEGNIDNNPPKKPNGDDDSVTVEIPTDAVKVADNAALDDAIKAGATKIVLTGNGAYIIPDSAQGKTLEIYGDGDQTIEIQDDGSYEGCDYSLDGATVTFNNVIIRTDSSAYAGYARCVATYNNCVIDGTVTLFGDAKFNYCTLEATGDVYNVWTWGANNVVFDHCTFNNDGKALLVYNSNCDVTVSNCVFNDSEALAPVKAAIETGVDNTNTFYNIIVNNVEVNGYAVNTTGYTANTSKLWANKNNMDRAHLNVVVDGVDEY